MPIARGILFIILSELQACFVPRRYYYKTGVVNSVFFTTGQYNHFPIYYVQTKKAVNSFCNGYEINPNPFLYEESSLAVA